MCHGSRAWPAPTSDLERGPILGVGAGRARDQSPRWPAALAQKNEAPSFTPKDCPLDLTVVRQTEESVQPNA